MLAKQEEKKYETEIEKGKLKLSEFEISLKHLRREKDLLASESADLAGLRLKQGELEAKEMNLQRLYTPSL